LELVFFYLQFNKTETKIKSSNKVFQRNEKYARISVFVDETLKFFD